MQALQFVYARKCIQFNWLGYYSVETSTRKKIAYQFQAIYLDPYGNIGSYLQLKIRKASQITLIVILIITLGIIF